MSFNILIDERLMPHAKNGEPKKEKERFLRNLSFYMNIAIRVIQAVGRCLQLDHFDKAKLQSIHKYHSF